FVETLAANCFREEIRDPAARVVRDLPLRLRRAAPRVIRLKEIRARHHHVDLERNAEGFAVLENGGVVVGETSRSGVEVETFVEFANLTFVRRLFEYVAAADGVIASAGAALRFE